jgi:hypothetical protein
VWATRGVTVEDTITATDCTDSAGTAFSDALAIIALNGTVLTIAERSGVVNPALSLYRIDSDSVAFVASNDDSTVGNPTAFLAYSVSSSAIYLIFAGTASAGETGPYTLAISASTTLSQSRAAEPAFGALDRRAVRTLLEQRRKKSVR